MITTIVATATAPVAVWATIGTAIKYSRTHVAYRVYDAIYALGHHA